MLNLTTSRRSRARTLFAGTALAGTFFGLTVAFAQETTPPPPSSGVEQVVVTARRRAEDPVKLPGQDTAFTAQMIDAKGITLPQEFLDAVPNVTFIPTQNAGTSFVVMRGISQARNSEPSAAIVVDGVPMTQPAEFNQELLDIQQIEVVKGPQGALYGRDAIGGAILITTAQPTDDWEARITGGYDNGPGGKAQGVISGPITDQLKIRAAVSYLNTDGVLRNADTVDASARHNAAPVEDFSGRFSAVYTPTSALTFDLILSTDLLNTQGLYYIIPPFGSANFNNPDFTSQPINLNNSGIDDRKIYDAALKVTYNADIGTLTSITGYSTIWEILTGDGYPFDPFNKSRIAFEFDQSQFLTAKTFTQEERLTSPSDQRFRWIVGAEIYETERFISTGNMFDPVDTGPQAIYRTPTPFFVPGFGSQQQISFLSDSQHQFAWAVYVDTSTDITKDLEFSLNMRFDNDHRSNTTDTPQLFLTAGGIPGATGQVRSNTWSAFQPQAILKYQWDENLSFYVDYSRGFRSGGFNQTGVAQAAAAAGFDNVGDQFGAEIANTFEGGFKSRWLNDTLAVNGSVYTTRDHNDYYFVFLASNSTQNLGNIPGVHFSGFDLDATARLDDNWTVNSGFGMTDSRITKFPGASSALVVGSKAPLVSDYTLDVGIQYVHPVWSGWDFLGRLDYNLIGPTVFVIPVPAVGEPSPQERNPVDLFDVRMSLQSDSWQVTAWSKNLFDKKYNAEYSTGGFLFKAQPRTWGLELTKRF
ncbi:MAG TPA: TonB-dependent receptor [Rhizomicrobium sp.]|nr:TonB-dependent receptor [Rhizomicrobium sp.]